MIKDKEKYDILIQLRTYEKELVEYAEQLYKATKQVYSSSAKPYEYMYNCTFLGFSELPLIASKIMCLIQDRPILKEHYTKQYNKTFKNEVVNDIVKYWNSINLEGCDKFFGSSLLKINKIPKSIICNKTLDNIVYTTHFVSFSSLNSYLSSCRIDEFLNHTEVILFYTTLLENEIQDYQYQLEALLDEDDGLYSINEVKVHDISNILDNGQQQVNNLYAKVVNIIGKWCEYQYFTKIVNNEIKTDFSHRFNTRPFFAYMSVNSVIKDLINFISELNFSDKKNVINKQKHCLKYNNYRNIDMYFLDGQKLNLTPENIRILKYVIYPEGPEEDKQNIRNKVSRINKEASKILGENTRLIVSPFKELPYQINPEIDTFNAY